MTIVRANFSKIIGVKVPKRKPRKRKKARK